MTASVSSAGSESRIGGFRLFRKSTHAVVVFRFGGHAISTGKLADFDAVVSARIVGEQFFQRGADARFDFDFVRGAGGQNFALHELDDVIQRDGYFGRV